MGDFLDSHWSYQRKNVNAPDHLKPFRQSYRHLDVKRVSEDPFEVSLRYRRSDFFSCFLKRLLASTCFPPNRCMVKQIFALLFVAIFLSPSFTTSVTEMCVTPVCRCSSYSSYKVTVICYTDDVKYNLNHSIKKPEEIVALYVNSYDSLFYILSSSLSFLFVIA